MISPYALIYLIAHVVPAIVGFLAIILYTHLLSPAEYGIYIIGASIAGIVASVFFAWVRLSVSRYQAKSPELDLRAEAIVAYGGMVGILACLAPVAIVIIHPEVGYGVLAASLLMALSLTAFEISQEFRRAQLNPLRFTIVALTRSVLALGLGYFAIESGGGGLGLLLAISASFLIANLLSLRAGAARPLRGVSVENLAQFVRYGLPFSLAALAFALHGALDRLGVAYLLGRSAAGYYGLAADMTRQLFGILAASVASAVFPMAFRSLTQSGPAATRERLKEGIELLLALIMPVSVWLAMSANLVAGTLLGGEFQASVAVLLPLLAAGRMFGAVNQYYLQASFQLAEKPLLQVLHDSVILLLNLALLFTLTHRFGLPGTAAAVLIAEGLGILIGISLSRRAFRLPMNGYGIARVMAATAIMALVTYEAKLASGGQGWTALLAAFGGGGLAYAGAAIVFNVANTRRLIGTWLWRAPEDEAVELVRVPRQSAG
jgi:O-antigen/teichoic acid export membrane protein